MLGCFGFLTNLECKWLHSKMLSYSVILLLRRSDLRKVFGAGEMVQFMELFEEAIDMRDEGHFSQPLAKYSNTLTARNSSVLFMKPSYTSNFTLSLFTKSAERFTNTRKYCFRTYKTRTKVKSPKGTSRVSVGVQCEPNTQIQTFETLLIL